MTWCNENSAAPALCPRQFGYPLSFRGQVCGVHAPSRVSRQWLSPRDASLPSFGSRRARFPARQRYYEGATTSHSRIPGRLLGSLPRSHAILLGSCLAAALPEARRTLPGQDLVAAGCPFSGSLVAWTRMGSLRSPGDPSCAFAPLQDPGRTDVPSPLTVTSMLPPLGRRRRLRR